jgi:hypothetical protein
MPTVFLGCLHKMAQEKEKKSPNDGTRKRKEESPNVRESRRKKKKR